MKIRVDRNERLAKEWVARNVVENASANGSSLHLVICADEDETIWKTIGDLLDEKSIHWTIVEFSSHQCIRLGNASVILIVSSLFFDVSEEFKNGKMSIYVCSDDSGFKTFSISWMNGEMSFGMNQIEDLYATTINNGNGQCFEYELPFEEFYESEVLRHGLLYKEHYIVLMSALGVMFRGLTGVMANVGNDQPLEIEYSDFAKDKCFLNCEDPCYWCAVVGWKVFVSRQCPFYAEHLVQSLQKKDECDLKKQKDGV